MREPGLRIGRGHTLRPVMNDQDQLVGWIHEHPHAANQNERCSSFLAVRGGYGFDVHRVQTVDPLTLDPCLRCRSCGTHGHVTNGRWEPC